MERQTQIVIGGVVLALLATGVYYQMQKDKKIGAPTSAADLPKLEASDDVDKVSIVNGEKGEVVLEKKGDKWQVTKPVTAPANESNIKSLLGNFKDLKVSELIAKNADEELKKGYELDNAKGVHVVAYKGADKKLDVTFGKTGGRGNMAALPAQPGIYAVTGYSGWMYTREAKDWRDKDIWKFDDANATQLTIVRDKAAKDPVVFSFTKGDKWAGTVTEKGKEKAIERLDEQKVKDAISAFKNLTADDFGDAKTEAGLDAPVATVTISLKDNAGKYVLSLGKTSTGESRWGQKEGDPVVYSISSWQAGWATANVDRFQKPVDGGAPKPDDHDHGAMPPGMMGLPPGMGMPPGHP